MTYKGEHLNNCRAVPFDWNNSAVVIVSGSGPNACGHAIANAGNYYFHIDGLNDRPWYMSHSGYLRYLRENSKRELRRRRVQVPDPTGAQFALETLSTQNWRWLGVPNNCASFVEEVFAGGGAQVRSWTNCPTLGWRT